MGTTSLVTRAAVAFALVMLAIPVPRAQTSAIRVVLLGTAGGPRPSAERAGPSAWVEAGGERLFVDAGRSVVQRLVQAGLEASAVTRLFLTHLHSDHVVGLPDLWLSGWWTYRTEPLEVRGPVGTRSMTQHLQLAFAADIDLRTGPPERLARNTAGIDGFDVTEGVVYESGGVRVTAIRVDHGPVPTFGYRIDHAGRSVVFSGDDRKSDNLIAKSQQVDVLFHPMSGFTPQELSEPGRMGERRRAALELLASPEDAAAVFTRSRCKVAILIHTSRDERSLARIRAGYGGRLEVADDLTEVLVGEDVVVKSLKRETAATSPQFEQRDQPVTADDVSILARAQALLKNDAAWNRQDDRECQDDEATGKRSLFCALHRACVDVLGSYDHRRVALQEVRFAVEDATRGRSFEHRLRDFNNLPETRLADIKRVLKVAQDRVRSRLKVRAK